MEPQGQVPCAILAYRYSLFTIRWFYSIQSVGHIIGTDDELVLDSPADVLYTRSSRQSPCLRQLIESLADSCHHSGANLFQETFRLVLTHYVWPSFPETRASLVTRISRVRDATVD